MMDTPYIHKKIQIYIHHALNNEHDCHKLTYNKQKLGVGNQFRLSTLLINTMHCFQPHKDRIQYQVN